MPKTNKVTAAYEKLEKCSKKECPVEHKRAWARSRTKDMQQLQAALDVCRLAKCKKDKALVDRLFKREFTK